MNIINLEQELAESWLNGNKKYVIEQILKFKKAKAIYLSLCIFEYLDYDNQTEFAKLFLNRI